MRTRYVRTELEQGDRVAAATVSLAVAAGVGLVTFYVARLFLARRAVTDSAEGETADVARR